MKHQLFPHQEEALAYALPRRRVALFLEMRLGKSPVAIRWAVSRASQRVLLVAPLPTLAGSLNWEGELQREGVEQITFLSGLSGEKRWEAMWQWTRMDSFLHKLTGQGLMRTRRPGWFLINYEALRVQPEILRQPWDTIILDESTRIRNPRAEITKVLLRNTEHIRNRAILSGLPNPESMLDFFSQFGFLDGSFMGYPADGGYWSFRQSKFHEAFYTWTPNKGVKDKIRAYVQARSFVRTRQQVKVGSKKIRKMRTVELNVAQRRAIKEIRKTFAYEGEETKWAAVTHLWLQRIAGGFSPGKSPTVISNAKYDLLHELLVDDFRRESVVVWFRFNEEIDYAYQYLQRWRETRNVERIHGQMGLTIPQRRDTQERFQSGKTRLLLIQAALAKFGWNLSRSSTAVYFSNHYELETRMQSEDRNIHLNKREPCLYVDLVTRGTPDEDVVDILQMKKLDAKSFNRAVTERIVARLREALS